MVDVREEIPDALQREVDAALAWFNRQEDVAFEVTAILDPDTAEGASESREPRLVLCGGDRCEQRSFRVDRSGDGYDVQLLDEPAPADGQLVPELDPPPGARRGWLDGVLGQHAFVLLVFYRGYW